MTRSVKNKPLLVSLCAHCQILHGAVDFLNFVRTFRGFFSVRSIDMASEDTSSDSPAAQFPGLQSLLKVVEKQMAASAAREDRLTTLLEQALKGAPPPESPSPAPQPKPNPNTKTVSVDRPVLLVSATMADFVAWEEAWHDYAKCQHLEAQDLATRRAALRQALDEDLRRFIREGIIAVGDQDDTSLVIDALRSYIRRQRNPLLDRLAFYGRRQVPGGSFDSFYTALHELYKASDFGSPLCSTCSGRVCSTCQDSTRHHSVEMLRDRVVCGVLDEAVRHKLLAEPNLTLDKATKICRAEEAAQQTGDSLPSTGQVNAARRGQSAYKRRQASTPKSKQTLSSTSRSGDSSAGKPHKPCPNCGRKHTNRPCPAADRTCGRCQQKGHFAHVCPNPPQQKRGANLAHLSLSRAAGSHATDRIPVDTRLECMAALQA